MYYHDPLTHGPFYWAFCVFVVVMLLKGLFSTFRDEGLLRGLMILGLIALGFSPMFLMMAHLSFWWSVPCYILFMVGLFTLPIWAKRDRRDARDATSSRSSKR